MRFIDVEFEDKTIHRNIHIPDNRNFVMGALNQKGLILASKDNIINNFFLINLFLFLRLLRE